MASERLNAAIAEMAKQDITFANCDSTWQKRVMTAVLAAADTRPAPAATVTGLVTRAFINEGDLNALPDTRNALVSSTPASWDGQLDKTIELVTRSQAVELLAAERAKYRDAMEKLVESQRETLVWQQRAIDLKADNAAKEERIKAETELREDHQKRNKELEAKLAAAEKALEPFAAIKTADGPEGSFTRIPDEHGLMFNMGTREPYFTVGDVRRARAVLGGGGKRP